MPAIFATWIPKLCAATGASLPGDDDLITCFLIGNMVVADAGHLVLQFVQLMMSVANLGVLGACEFPRRYSAILQAMGKYHRR